MPADVDQPAPARPPRIWRPMVGWTLGILAALGLAWFVGAVAVPVLQVDENEQVRSAAAALRKIRSGYAGKAKQEAPSP